MEEKLIINGINELPELAKSILSIAGSLKIWLFYGEMGSGKTTLIKNLCALLNVSENVSSPTYSIVNEYQNDQGDSFYHFDFYRIKSEAEVLDIGYEEYFYSGNLCFVEWPEKIASLIPDQFLKIEIQRLENDSRLIYLSRHE